MYTPHSKDGTDAPDFDDDGIHGKNYDNEDEDFSYHLSDELAEEEIDNHGELGVDAVGTSPLVTSASTIARLGRWMISQIGCRRSPVNERMIRLIFLQLLLPKSFPVLLAATTRMSTTPQHGFQSSC
jgi:hypothetical protein